MKKFYMLFGNDKYGYFSRRFEDKKTAIETTRLMFKDSKGSIAKRSKVVSGGKRVEDVLILQSLRECYEGGEELIWDVDLNPTGKCIVCGNLHPINELEYIGQEGDKPRPYCASCGDIT
jgi:hypothetical protein